MNKYFKRALSIILSLVMLLTVLPYSLTAYSDDLVFTPEYNNSSSAPYIENDVYYRLSDGQRLEFNTNYDDLVSYFRNAMINHQESIDYYFATNDTTYQYRYETTDDADLQDAACKKLFNDLYSDIFTTDLTNPCAGDYLYNSFNRDTMVHYVWTYTSAADAPKQGNDRYYTFHIQFSNLEYYTTTEQERYIADFADYFKTNFINSGNIQSSNTDYYKVKTIYDFVVRNIAYDDEVYKKQYPSTDCDRYLNANNAYGALLGNRITYDDNGNYVEASLYDYDIKQSFVDQPIIDDFGQGKSVCVGYAKLFQYLCIDNGIACRIVDGDFDAKSGKASDPHEWNYVYLDDGTDEGARWFNIDCTYASQNSFPQIDYCCYDYFLVGTNNDAMQISEHPVPYTMQDTDKKVENHDWYADENKSSASDYKIQYQQLPSSMQSGDNLLIERIASYDDGDTYKYAFIQTGPDGTQRTYIDEKGDFTVKTVNGFNYNGHKSKFVVIVPYLVPGEYKVDDIYAMERGTYDFTIYGNNSTTCTSSFKIMPYDMDTDTDYVSKIQSSGNYTGSALVPSIEIIDGYGNTLNGTENQSDTTADYIVTYYKDGKQVDSIVDMGTYQVKLSFYGDYAGTYTFNFTVGKIDLSAIYSNFSFKYLPLKQRDKNNINNITDYFLAGITDGLSVGTVSLYSGSDFTASSNGSMEYGDSGNITLTATDNSEKVVAGTSTNIGYNVDKQYDISYIDGLVADTNKTNQLYYTGSAQTPTAFDWLDSNLVQGTEYVITGYSNNTNAGEAKVNIKGVNGCAGTATLSFVINKAPISVTYTQSGYTFNFIVKSKVTGDTLTQNTDYTINRYTTDTGYKYVVQGINNYSGSYTLNVNHTHKYSVYVIKKATLTSDGSYKYVCSDCGCDKENSTTTIPHLKAPYASKYTYTYSGKVQAPTIYVKDYKGTTLKSGTDYTLTTPSGRKNVGVYKYKIVYKGKYSGTSYVSYTIIPKNTSLSSLTAKSKAFVVKWKKYTTQTTGYQIQYSTSSKFTTSTTKTVTKNSTTSLTVSKLTAKKKYYVRIRTYKTVSGTKYYSSWSSAKTVTTK